MNPFENIENNKTNISTNTITIWVETYGKKKNTYIQGLHFSNDQMKDILKTIKKKNGCNGCIKTVPSINKNTMETQLQFQGEHVEYLISYLKTLGINDVIIKG
jgi:translation initiation factor 1 (eIF-1/SUI1)